MHSHLRQLSPLQHDEHWRHDVGIAQERVGIQRSPLLLLLLQLLQLPTCCVQVYRWLMLLMGCVWMLSLRLMVLRMGVVLGLVRPPARWG